MVIPTEIARLEKERAVQITWDDGHAGVYPNDYLRAKCSCASCVDEWTRQPLISQGSIPTDIKIEDLSLVGRYAIRIHWSDGHETGIYPFDYLRELCPCSACMPQGIVKTW